MNAWMLKRLFKVAKDGTTADLMVLCEKVVEDERKKGHSALATQLDSILKKKGQRRGGASNNLRQLPTNRRYNDPLVSEITHEELRHHMVLPEEVETKFSRVEKEYAARERLARHGLEYRKKILLYGPPGCGKTLGAERLAWNTGLPLVKVRFDAMISSYFGESAANLRTVFDSTKEKPCLLFLDECDFIAKSRNSSNDVGEIPRIVNTLLQLLEDYDSPGLLVAATNLDTMLDRALFRRFDDVFEVPMPGGAQIGELLKLTLSAVKLSKEINWSSLAEKLDGKSAASVVLIAQNAAKHVVLDNRKIVEQADLEISISETNS